MTREQAKRIFEERILDFHIGSLAKNELIKIRNEKLREDIIMAEITFACLMRDFPPHINEYFHNFVVYKFTPRELSIMKNLDEEIFKRQYEEFLNYLIDCSGLLNAEVKNDG